MDEGRSTEVTGDQIMGGSIGSGNTLAFILCVTGSQWKVLSKAMLDILIFSFHRITLAFAEIRSA